MERPCPTNDSDGAEKLTKLPALMPRPSPTDESEAAEKLGLLKGIDMLSSTRFSIGRSTGSVLATRRFRMQGRAWSLHRRR